MQDGLYLNNTWVAEVDVVLNKQANDLTSPATLQTSYANTFTLPDTTAIRSLLQNAEQLDAGGRDPYRLIPAKLLEEGEVTFSGTAALQSFSAGWKVLLSGPARSLFDQLSDLKLSDLDLAQYNHPWTLNSVALFAGKTDGILYPCIDYGSLDGGVFAQDTITPAIYISTLIRLMLKQCGYRATGNWLDDALIRRIFLPFVGDLPTNHDQQWVEDRQARVGVPANPQPIVLKNGSPIDLILPLTVDYLPLDNFQDGKLDCYKAERATYVCREAGKFNVQATVTFVYLIRYGAPEIRLQVLRNGQPVAEAYWSEAGYKDQLDLPTTFSLDETITCRAGDELQIRLQGNAKTDLASYGVYFSQSLGELYAAFAPDPRVHEGDIWPVAQNLPDLSCADVIKSVALLCSATFEIDDVKRTIELKLLDAIVSNEAHATDLSQNIEESVEPEYVTAIGSYAQRNLLKWKALDDKTLAGYGDGVIRCDAQNLPLETTLFELPFSAVVDSTNNVPGLGFPPFIETRKITGSGSTRQVNPIATTPRLLLAEPSKMITVTVNAITPDLTTVPTKIQLMGCWWHQRPTPVVTGSNGFSLAFDRPSGNTSYEQTMIQRYFNGLRRILRRPRQLSISAYLRPAELATLDLYAPVRLRGVRCGGLDINDNYFYLNKVSNYRPGVPCTLILIAF